jgi:hypothetical protein
MASQGPLAGLIDFNLLNAMLCAASDTFDEQAGRLRIMETASPQGYRNRGG